MIMVEGNEGGDKEGIRRLKDNYIIWPKRRFFFSILEGSVA